MGSNLHLGAPPMLNEAQGYSQFQSALSTAVCPSQHEEKLVFVGCAEKKLPSVKSVPHPICNLPVSSVPSPSPRPW